MNRVEFGLGDRGRPCGNRSPAPVLPAPLPWTLNAPGFSSGYCVVTAADGRPVAAAMTGGHERPFEAAQVALHGRLMRAAPEMAATLRRLVAEFCRHEDVGAYVPSPGWLDGAEALLAQVEGGA